MIKELRLENVGPIASHTFEFAPRINVITGDNGLGKTFLLDLVWFALTRKWPVEVNSSMTSGFVARPLDKERPAVISTKMLTEANADRGYDIKYDRKGQYWPLRKGRQPSAGMVIYAHIDGSFSVWDKARNYWKDNEATGVDRPPAFVFTPGEVWNGLRGSDGTKLLCRGLIADWCDWQKSGGREFQLLASVLEKVSPPGMKIAVGTPTRISLDDVRDIPAIIMPYGEIPVLWASSALKRILSFAYFLVWVFSEHRRACEITGNNPADQITLIVDELEAHLHPKWQRTVMRGIVNAVESLLATDRNEFEGCGPNIQVVASTHSPLIMSSLEDEFNSRTDAWFDLDFSETGDVLIEKRDFMKLGGADSWLKGLAFDLKSTRSVKAEVVIERATEVLSDSIAQVEGGTIPRIRELKGCYDELSGILNASDPYLQRFKSICDIYGWEVA